MEVFTVELKLKRPPFLLKKEIPKVCGKETTLS